MWAASNFLIWIFRYRPPLKGAKHSHMSDTILGKYVLKEDAIKAFVISVLQTYNMDNLTSTIIHFAIVISTITVNLTLIKFKGKNII